MHVNGSTETETQALKLKLSLNNIGPVATSPSLPHAVTEGDPSSSSTVSRRQRGITCPDG